MKILIGVTGSVATIKLNNILNEIYKRSDQHDIKIIATQNSLHFISLEEVKKIELYTDEDEWKTWGKRGDPVLHIELVKWADILLVAPLDANTLAKFSNGLCDNLLTCVFRAWSLDKSIILCPAMNTKMYQHCLTERQIDTIKSFGNNITFIDPISKGLMCGDTGIGAMEEPERIIEKLFHTINTIN